MPKALCRRTALGVLALSLCLLPLTSCGSSGGSDDDGGSADFSLNACQAVGLKIVNGTICNADDTPAGSPIVRLGLYNRFGQPEGSCSGVVIGSHAVLTAAHCFEGNPAEVDVETFVGVFGARSWHIQPEYTSVRGTAFGDSAVVITRDRIPLPTAPLLTSRAPEEGEEAIVAGFGETEPQSGATDFLVAGNASISSVSENHVVIRFRENEAHPCFCDSGGPILVEVNGIMAVAGVVSQSDVSVPADTYCRIGDMTLYTNTENPATRSFILRHVPNAGLL